MNAEVFKELYNSPNSIPAYLAEQWKRARTENKQFILNILEQCYQLMIGSLNLADIEPFFKNLKDQGLLQFGTCDVTWSFGDAAYKCKTCQLDPTTAMCINCFNAGDHEGHDYALQSVAGGFCDCGDPSAFKINGFCHKHKELKDIVDLRKYPERFILSLCYVVQFVLEKIYNFFENNMDNEYEIYMDWLLKLSQRGDVVKMIVIKYLTNTEIGTQTTLLPPSPFKPSLLEQFYHPSKHNDVFESMKLTFVNFCVFLRGSVEMTHQMIHAVIPTYKQCILDSRNHMLLNAFTVFSTQSVSDLLLQVNASSIVIDTILEYFQRYFIYRSSWMKKKQKIIKVKEEFVPPLFGYILHLPASSASKQLSRLRTDIGFIMSNRAIASTVVSDPQQLIQWFRMVSLSQGMNPNLPTRDTSVDDWSPAFNIDISFSSTLFSLVDVLKRDRAEIERVLLMASQVLGKWILGWIGEHQAKLELKQPDIAQIIQESTKTDGFSYHLVLHRSIASFVHIAVSELADEFHAAGGLHGIFSRIIGENSPISLVDYARCSIAHPLRLMAALGEIKAGLWRAHGREEDMQAQTMMYLSLHYQRFYDLDIFMVQIGSVLMGTNSFMEQVLTEYSLQDWFRIELPTSSSSSSIPATPSKALRQSSGAIKTTATTTTSSSQTTSSQTTNKTAEEKEEEAKEKKEKKKQADEFNKRKILAEDFIQFIIMISTNKTLIGMTTHEIIRKELIHRLCLGEATHSQLVRNVKSTLVHHPDFDKILNEIATFQTPQKTEQGKYQLKEACWSEFDPYFAHYNVQDLQTAEERYQEFNNKTKTNISRGTYMSYKTLPSMEAIDSLLCSKLVHQVIFTILQNHLVNSQKSTETLLTHTLHALELCVLQTQNMLARENNNNTKKQSTPQKQQRTTHDSLATEIEFPSSNNIFINANHEVNMENKKMSLMILLVKLSTLQGISADHKQQLQNILNILMEQDSSCKLTVENYWQALRAKKNLATPGKREDPEEEKKRLAKARQAAILAQMKTQQAAFKFDDDDDYEDEDDLSASQAKDKKTEKVDSNLLVVDGQLSNHTCALCREAGSLKRPMGRVAFIQPSSVLMLSKLTAEERNRRMTEAIKKDLIQSKSGEKEGDEQNGKINQNTPSSINNQNTIHNALNDLLGQNEMDEEDLEDVDMGSDDDDTDDEVGKAISYLNKISNYNMYAEGMDMFGGEDMDLDDEGYYDEEDDDDDDEEDDDEDDEDEDGDDNMEIIDFHGHGHGHGHHHHDYNIQDIEYYSSMDEDDEFSDDEDDSDEAGGYYEMKVSDDTGNNNNNTNSNNNNNSTYEDIQANIYRFIHDMRGRVTSATSGRINLGGNTTTGAADSNATTTTTGTPSAATSTSPNANPEHIIDDGSSDSEDDMDGEGGLFDNPFFDDNFEDDVMDKFDDASEPVCGNPWSNKFSKQELFRNTEESVNLHMSFCGHQIHEDCFTDYSWSQLKNQNYEGEELVDAQKGEFQCVLCRRLGNALVPVIPDSGFETTTASPTPKADTYQAFLQSLEHSLLNTDQISTNADSLKPVRQAIEQFASRVYSVRHQLNFYHSESNEKVLPFISSSIASTIADTELSSRVPDDDQPSSSSYPLFGMTESNRVDIRSLFRVSVAHVKTHTPISFENHLLWNTISGQMAMSMPPVAQAEPTDSEEKKKQLEDEQKKLDETHFPPFLSLDLFHNFIQLYLRTSVQDSSVTANNRFYMMVRMYFDAIITQTIFAHFKTFEENAPPTTEMFITEVNKLITTPNDNQNTISNMPSHLSNLIRSNCLIFLRRVSLFLYACLNVNAPKTTFALTNDEAAEIHYLMNYLQLYTPFESQLINVINTLITHSDSLVPLVSKWSEQMLSSYAIYLSSEQGSSSSSTTTLTTSSDNNNNNNNNETQTNSEPLSIITSPRIPNPFLLINLEKNYSTLSQHYASIPCLQCKTISNSQALCLICGTLCCIGGCCKRFFDQKSEYIMHAEKCGAGTCLFLVIKSSSILMIHLPRKTYWISPYLDDHGEEDPNLKRGKPLFLNMSRYNQLNSLLVKHQIDQDSKIAEHTVRE